ncbi:MAG: hypothetical protein ABID64_01640, partial [Nitrospirota bacterium]
LEGVYEMFISSIPVDVEWEEQFGTLDRDQFVEMLRDVYSSEDLVAIVENVEKQIKEAKFNEEGILYLNIPFDWMKEKAPILAESIAEMVIGDLEPCESIAEFDVNQHNCIPEGVLVSTVKDGVKLELEEQILVDVPEVYEFEIDTAGIDAQVGEDVSDYFMGILNNAFIICLVVLAVVLLLIALVVFRPFTRVMKWEFRAIFLASIIPLVTFISLYFLAEKLEFTETQAQFDLIALLIRSLSQTLIYHLVPIVIVSLGFWILFMVFDKKNEPKGSS